MAPSDYFELRLRSLLLVVADSDAVDALFAGGLAYKDFKLTSDDSPEPNDKDRYAATESVVLLHHACETMVRLYLAHADRNLCPWLAVAGNLKPKDFKEQAARLLGDLDKSEVMDDVMEVFAYTNSSGGIGGTYPPEVWKSHRSGLKILLQFALRNILDDARMYNATKDGLAVVAGRKGVSIGPPQPDGSHLLAQDGLSILYLEKVWIKKVPVWQETTRWVFPTEMMTGVYLISQQIASLWNVARAHYKVDKLKHLHLHLLEVEKVEGILRKNLHNGFNISSMSESLSAHPDAPSLKA